MISTNQINVNDQSKNQITNMKVAFTDATQPANMLELFAEELPDQHDKLGLATVGTVACGGTGAGSTVSTFSTYSSVS